MTSRTPCKAQQKRLRLRDQSTCVYCKSEPGAVFDHVLPWKHGGKTIDANLVMSCTDCNSKKKGDLNESMITIAFKHLLDVGESLAWLDLILGQTSSPPPVEETHVVNPLLPLPAPIMMRQPVKSSCAPSVLTEEKRRQRRVGGYKRMLRRLTLDIAQLQASLGKSE